MNQPHQTRTSYSLELVDNYLAARASGDKAGITVAGIEIYAWLRDSCSEITTRLLTLVMAMARRRSETQTLDQWHGAMRYTRIDQEEPANRLAMRLVLAYGADDEDSAYELLLPLLRSCALESLVTELMLTFLCLAKLHELHHASTAGGQQ